MAFNKSIEAQILDSATLGFGRNLYLRLVKWTGPAGAGAGKTVGKDASFPIDTQEVNSGGYAPLLIQGARWSAAVAGSPTIKVVPKPGSERIEFTAVGYAFGEICGYVWTTDQNPITSSNLVSSGFLADSSGSPTSFQVLAGESLVWDEVNPITERIGGSPNFASPE